MSDFTENQKKNCISAMSTSASQIVELATSMRAIIEKWQSFGITPQQLIDSGILADSSFSGLSATALSNFIGSMDNFVSVWYAANGVNARLMTE